VVALCGPLWAAGLAGATLGSSIDLQSDIARQAAVSQAQIDQTYEVTRRLLDDYQTTMRELESSRRYNDHLEKMVRGQERAIAALQQQHEQIEVTRREIVPLMARMVDTLAKLLELDVPFLLEERRARVEQLQRVVDSPAASLAEKYRQIMEAYEIEAEYGRTVEAYRGTLSLGGTERTVDFLRLGRISLIYRSLSGTEAGVWDQASRSWKELPDGYRSSLERGFRVARKQAAPDLLTVPVPAPARQVAP